MLACVCQPADAGIFSRSPVPLGAQPLKFNHKGAVPKPGRTLRVPVITSEPGTGIINRRQLGGSSGKAPKNCGTERNSGKTVNSCESPDIRGNCRAGGKNCVPNARGELKGAVEDDEGPKNGEDCVFGRLDHFGSDSGRKPKEATIEFERVRLSHSKCKMKYTWHHYHENL